MKADNSIFENNKCTFENFVWRHNHFGIDYSFDDDSKTMNTYSTEIQESRFEFFTPSNITQLKYDFEDCIFVGKEEIIVNKNINYK